MPLILEQILENSVWKEGHICLLGLTWWVLGLTVFRGLTSPCLPRMGRAMPYPQSPQKRGIVSAGLSPSETSAESSHWHVCQERRRVRKCQRVSGIIRPQPSKLPPTQTCQTLQQKSSRCVSFFTYLMAEKKMHQGRLVGPVPIDWSLLKL